jgi:hypothetical protein
MAANTSPISPAAPNTGFAATVQTTANTALDGTGTVIGFFTAGANGSRVNRIRVVHRGTNIATVLRIFVNNGSTNGTAGNNSLVHEVTMAANTLSQTAASIFQDLPVNIVLKPAYVLNYTVGTTVATGFAVTCPDGGDY